MQTVLIVIHIMVVVALIAVVLLQRSEGGALGIGGGGGFMTGRGQANVLTRATAILAGLFFATSLALTILANVNKGSKSILEGATPPPGPSAPAPAVPKGQGTLLEQLQKLQEQREQQKLPPAANESSVPPPAAPAPPKSQ